MLLIPVKNLVNAKQRLSLVLNQPERTELAHAMLWDVLTAVSPEPASTPASSPVIPLRCNLQSNSTVKSVTDKFNPGETGAIEMATHICESRDIETTIVIPANIPLVQTEEIESDRCRRARTRFRDRSPHPMAAAPTPSWRRPAGLVPSPLWQ